MVELWDRVLEQLGGQLDRQTFDNWFKPTHQVSREGNGVNVWVPSRLFADWIEEKFRPAIQESLVAIGEPGITIQFLCGDDEAEAVVPAPAAEHSAATNLNLRYTFGNFVVSSCNEFAHAACRAVAELPSRRYNPLYIYGGVGLGKTHLMQAIGNAVADRLPGRRMHYLTTENFMNELINAIRFEKTIDFKQKYRNVDLLLIDDVQFLAGKERTQEEFFHTFNALHDAQKQIVLTSDCPPREIPTLEERLRSRFEWGLIADIQPPDLETKIAILRKKAEQERIDLPEDVALFIATKIRSNIRELEGSLIRVVAYSSLTGREIDLGLAKETLRDLLQDDNRSITVESIQKYVSDYYRLRPAELKEKDNRAAVAFPRQVAMYLCKNLTELSLPEIGRRFGGKHHSTVIHSIRKIERKRQASQEFDRLVNSFLESFRAV